MFLAIRKLQLMKLEKLMIIFKLKQDHGANIIMGVGEDEKLGEAISVTVIATGFDVDQQNDITNVEPKKVVHALEDEQINGTRFN